LWVFIISILSVPMLFIKNKFPDLKIYFNILAFFILTTLIFFSCYWVSYKSLRGGGFKNFINFTGLFFTFYTIVMGFSFHNTMAVLEGLLGKKSAFIRTPKLNIEALKDNWKDNIYLSKNISKNIIFESLLFFYFIFGLYSGFQLNDFALFPFHLMLSVGFGFVVYKSFKSI
jgi:hypothetical protein